MTPSFEQELLKRLDLLSSKLGVTAEGLWRILIAQARVKIIENCVAAGICFCLAVACGFFARWLRKGGISEEAPFDLFAISVVATAVFSIVGIYRLFACITPALNPQFWALKQLMP